MGVLKNKKGRGALVFKSPVDPNLQALVTLRDGVNKTYPICKISQFFWMEERRYKKDWITLKDLYHLHFFLARLMTLLEDYYAGDVDLAKLLDSDIDFSIDEDFIEE